MVQKAITKASVGDWVQAYSPGIWQVLGVLEGFYETRLKLDERKRVSRRGVVFVKRLVDDKWHKSFKVESCEGGLVNPLTDGERVRLREFTASNPDVMEEFSAFSMEIPGRSLTLRFNMPEPADFEERRAFVEQLFAGIDRGFTNDEVLERVEGSLLAAFRSYGLTNTTLRFYCRSHELRDQQFVFRRVDVLPF